jgi:hypothetical protein
MKDGTSGISLLTSNVIFLFTETGEKPIGTAFLIGYPSPRSPGMVVPMVVTAKHVIGDQQKIAGRYTGSQGKPAMVLYDLGDLRSRGDLWEHTDDGVDMLVFRTDVYKGTEMEAVPLEFIASKEDFLKDEIKATDPVVFPFLLAGFMGSSRNYPVMRNGSIALIPDEPVPLRYPVGSRMIKTEQEVILIDAASIHGASGSPVFLGPGLRVRSYGVSPKGAPWLIGVMHGFYKDPVTKENSGIAIVFPSWRLLEILQREDVKDRVLRLE